MSYFIGVDGGNTKTIAFVSTSGGSILGAARSGCSDIYGAASAADALEQIKLAVEIALERAGLQSVDIEASYFCLAGADWPEDYAFLDTAISRFGFGRKITIGNDSLGALRAGTPDGTGVVITCGTGIATAARNAEGLFWQSGFWQESLCGIELGKLALRAVYRSELGIDSPTALTTLVLNHFGQNSVEALLHRFWNREAAPPTSGEVSKLAPIVLNAAEAGDIAAEGIVQDHGVRLAEYAIVAAHKVHLNSPSFPLILNGGIFRHPGQKLIQAIINHLRPIYPHVTPIRSRFEPVVGALLLALETAGIIITDDIIGKLEYSLPSPELFLT
ncbi:MAG: hypothetical protein IAE89_15325 [Anaerolineae bacterium]|nr:hypothetical protein [Anaerolineae bacterium]